MQWKNQASWRCLCPNTNTQTHRYTHMSTHTHVLLRSRACSHAQTLHVMGRGRGREWAQAGPGRRVCFPRDTEGRGPQRVAEPMEGVEVGRMGQFCFPGFPQPSSHLFVYFPSLAELERQAAFHFPPKEEKGCDRCVSSTQLLSKYRLEGRMELAQAGTFQGDCRSREIMA